MKDAILWKRILNQGIVDGGAILNPEVLVRKIITSRIIVDRRLGSLQGDFPWASYGAIAFPFDRFWLEGGIEDCGNRWGALVERSAEDAFEFVLVLGQAQAGPTLAGTITARFDQSGRLKDAADLELLPPAPLVEQFGADEVARVAYTVFGFAIDLLVILGCKNVSLDPRDNDPKQVARAIKRHGDNAGKYRYHVLVVRPPGARSDSPAQEVGTMPRHVCRGHFSEYGPEFGKGLLFGKYAGRFYIPPHLKGKIENGEVAKDYAIAAR